MHPNTTPARNNSLHWITRTRLLHTPSLFYLLGSPASRCLKHMMLRVTFVHSGRGQPIISRKFHTAHICGFLLNWGRAERGTQTDTAFLNLASFHSLYVLFVAGLLLCVFLQSPYSPRTVPVQSPYSPHWKLPQSPLLLFLKKYKKEVSFFKNRINGDCGNFQWGLYGDCTGTVKTPQK